MGFLKQNIYHRFHSTVLKVMKVADKLVQWPNGQGINLQSWDLRVQVPPGSLVR